MNNHQEKNQKSKQRKQILFWVGAVCIVAALALMPMLASQKKTDSGNTASILSAEAGYQTLNTQIIGGGQLESETSVRLKIPEEVKLKKYLVGNGDRVRKGDPIAEIDKVSVMAAISQVQETLNELSRQIRVESSSESNTVTARSSGTVKVVYAQKGDSAQDVMLEHGALAVLSLDNTMAVKLEVDTDLRVGDTVSVDLPDAGTVSGRVKLNQNRVLTVTVADKNYAVGTKATVKTEKGKVLGDGELYILSPWNATAYEGTVSGVSIKQGASVSAGQTLFQLSGSGKSAQFQRLVDRRQEYEELMQELFEMYRTESVVSPCDGIVTGVDKNGTFLLSNDDEDAQVAPLSFGENTSGDSLGVYACNAVGQPDGISVQLLSEVVYNDSQSDNSSGENGGDIGNVTITFTGALNTGVAGQPYSSTIQAFDGSGNQLSGTWSAEWLPGGLSIDTASGTISGIPASAKDYLVTVFFNYNGISYPKEYTLVISTPSTKEVYYGYAAQILEIVDGAVRVKQKNDPYTINDLSNLPTVSANADDMTEEKLYQDGSISASGMKAGDTVLIVVNQQGGFVKIAKIAGSGKPEEGGAFPGGKPGGGGMPGGGAGGMGAGGAMPGGTGQTEEDSLYTQEKLTIASVTSQESMTLDITVDEWDISKISVGQNAVITVDALAGERFDAVVTEISNSGTNEGGNSKFTVELTLSKSGEMLPGMHASASIRLSEEENALCIPAAALSENDGQTVVYTSYDPERNELGGAVPVTIGIADAENVQIIDGISPGQTVYYPYYDTLSESNLPDMGAMPLGGIQGKPL